jgi:hypothetical protein
VHSHQADHYRVLAAECTRRAARAKTTAGRQQWATIASRYLNLADEYDKLHEIEPAAELDLKRKGNG